MPRIHDFSPEGEIFVEGTCGYLYELRDNTGWISLEELKDFFLKLVGQKNPNHSKSYDVDKSYDLDDRLEWLEVECHMTFPSDNSHDFDNRFPAFLDLEW